MLLCLINRYEKLGAEGLLFIKVSLLMANINDKLSSLDLV